MLSLAGAIISFDQLLKILVVNSVKPSQSLEVISGFFSITLVHNYGAAFGLFSKLDPSIRDPFFTLVPVLSIAVLLFIFQRVEEKNRMAIFSISSIVGGVIGNLIDRSRLGYVIDFLNFHVAGYHFLSFNLADSTISVGVLCLLIQLYLRKGTRAKA